MNETLLQYINSLDDLRINEFRKKQLDETADKLSKIFDQDSNLCLNFICTHNSRRSVLAQVWAQVAAQFYGKKSIKCFSGGTEETAVYPMIIQILQESGLFINQQTETKNPVYQVEVEDVTLELFSKTYDHEVNPKLNMIAIMTCSHADQNCPMIPNAKSRFSLTYEDPKISDHSPEQHQTYFERSMQIANEMFYLFSKIAP